MANDYWLDRARRRMREGMNRPGGPMPDEAELIATFVAWQSDKAAFTRADVALLRHAAEYAKPAHPELLNLADRIAALLPSE